MAERPEVGIRFLTAYLRGARDYCDAFDQGFARQDMIDLLVKETGESPELLDTMKPLGFSPNGVVDLERLAVELDILRGQRLIPADTHAGDVVDNRFAEAALEQLGPYR
jgi:NitT/TauT family transport system substrate-binding protein